VIWSRTDWGLFIGGLGLSLIGALLVWSATRHQSGSQYLARHLLNTGIGMALAAALTLVDFRGLRAYAPWLYLVSVAGLVLVMTPSARPSTDHTRGSSCPVASPSNPRSSPR